MKYLIIGCGGREHMILKTLAKNPNHEYFYCGSSVNPGMEDYAKKIDLSDVICKDFNIDIAIIGSETYLEEGLVDKLSEIGVRCIGPKKALAKIETSKSYCRQLMTKYGMNIYSPKYKIFNYDSDIEICKSYLLSLSDKYVVKADGLHGGKGVKVSGDHLNNLSEAIDYCQQLMTRKEMFVVEEKLLGEEFSYISLTDGTTVKHTLPVQDYKRAYNDNKGPNTGSMGSVSYDNHLLPFLERKDLEICQKINSKVIESLYQETGEYYCGIIYGSYIKTNDGEIKVIEFNARFGDPECINLLSLLKTDLSQVFETMVGGILHTINLEFEEEATCVRYLVPRGYPFNPVKKHEIYLDDTIDKDSVFYASVNEEVCNGEKYLYELGSRTLAILGKGNTMQEAVQSVEKTVKHVHGPLFSRTDIPSINKITYEDAGVNIKEGNKVVQDIRSYVESTFNANVLNRIGDFAGMYQINENQVLVSSTDGVGTKSLLVLEKYGKERGYEMLGHDLVNHCVNDILVKGARPLFFLDYYASSKIKAEYVKYFVKGLSDACREVGCVLIGGETAEMPDVYREEACDIVGTIVGVVNKDKIINGKEMIKEEDLILALPSSGPHTNGYSLIRKLVDEDTPQEIVENLCASHKCYYHEIMKLLDNGVKVNGLCHITGGGWVDNPLRVLPKGLTMHFDRLESSTVFEWIQNRSGIDDEEMLRTYNCGTGMIVFVDKESLARVEGLEGLQERVVGKVIR